MKYSKTCLLESVKIEKIEFFRARHADLTNFRRTFEIHLPESKRYNSGSYLFILTVFNERPEQFLSRFIYSEKAVEGESS